MEDEILLRDLLGLIKRNIKMILILIVIFVSISALITEFLMKPVYQATTQILINQKSISRQSSEYGVVRSNLQVMKTYRVLIKSPRILEKIQKNNPSYTVKQLSEIIEVYNEANSQVITITVRDSNAENVIKLANDTAEILEKEIRKIVTTDNIKVLSKADKTTTKTPVSPMLRLNIAIAFVWALMLSFIIIFIRFKVNRKVSLESEVEEITEGILLGSVRNVSKRDLSRM